MYKIEILQTERTTRETDFMFSSHRLLDFRLQHKRIASMMKGKKQHAERCRSVLLNSRLLQFERGTYSRGNVIEVPSASLR